MQLQRPSPQQRDEKFLPDSWFYWKHHVWHWRDEEVLIQKPADGLQLLCESSSSWRIKSKICFIFHFGFQWKDPDLLGTPPLWFVRTFLSKRICCFQVENARRQTQTPCKSLIEAFFFFSGGFRPTVTQMRQKTVTNLRNVRYILMNKLQWHCFYCSELLLNPSTKPWTFTVKCQPPMLLLKLKLGFWRKSSWSVSERIFDPKRTSDVLSPFLKLFPVTSSRSWDVEKMFKCINILQFVSLSKNLHLRQKMFVGFSFCWFFCFV